MNQGTIKVEYIDSMGDELTVVNAARVSFDKESEYDYSTRDGEYYVKDSDKKLILYLAKHNHWTPFSHCTITLRETVPIFVARQRFKHTVGFTYNEISRRYVDSKPEFYSPNRWRKRAENKKQGSSSEFVDYEVYGEDNHGKYSFCPTSSYNALVESSIQLYNDLLDAEVAPEMARMVLPQSMMTSYYVTGSLAAFARAYKLRSTEDSQYEIQLVAKEWDTIIRNLFPVSWSALVD